MRRPITLFCLTTVIMSAACAGADDEHAEAAGDGAVTQVASAQMPSDAVTASADTIEVWKDPNCGCCKSWVEHMRKHGFTVIAHDTADMTPVKQRNKVGADLASCHTGVIRGYTIEGHVPADLVRKMLDEKPAIAGLAVPGMPMGSPGMEGGRADKYDVIAFTADGGRKVYASR
jgi:hypothetical protein